MKGLRVLELSEALNIDSSDLLAVCAILKIKATSRLSMLSFEECKKITDYYENKNFKEPNTEEKLYLIIEHLDELIKEKGDHGLLIARKHISWTCKDFKGASNLRNNLVRAVDKNEVKNLIIKMIKTLNNEKNTLA